MTSFFKYSDIELVTVPVMYFKKQKICFNFDAVLQLDGDLKHDTIIVNAKLAGIPIYGMGRYDKEQQSIMLNSAGINMPDTWFSNIFSDCNDGVSLLCDVKDSEKLVLKYTFGARGLGQALLTMRELIDIMDSSNDELNKLFENTDDVDKKLFKNTLNTVSDCAPLPQLELLEQSNSKSFNPKRTPITECDSQLAKLQNIKINKHDSLLSAIKNRNNFIIQRYIPTRAEWRMLWFYGQDPIVIARNVTDGSWQANACNNAAGASLVIEISNISKTDDFDYDVINEFMRGLNAPFMSVDVYRDYRTNKWGLFEFQMEFGWTNTAGIDSTILHKKMINSIKHLIIAKQ